MTRHQGLHLLRGRGRRHTRFGFYQPNGVNTVSLEFFDSVLVDDGLLQSTFQLPQPLLSLFCISDGASLFNTHLEMAHECVNTWFLGHALHA